MARKRNPETNTLLLLGGGAVALYLLLRKKDGGAPVGVEEPVVEPADDKVVVTEQPPVLVEQQPPAQSQPSKGVLKVSLTAGSPAGKLFIDGHLLGFQPVAGIPVEPSSFLLSLPDRDTTLQIQYADGKMSDKVTVAIKSGLTKTVTIAPPAAANTGGSIGTNSQQSGGSGSGSGGGFKPGYLKLSLDEGSGAGTLYINDQKAPQPATGIPVVPASYTLPYAPTTVTLKIKYADGKEGDKGTITIEPGVTKTVIFAHPKTALIASGLSTGLKTSTPSSSPTANFGVGLKTSSLSSSPSGVR
jgi:hypothetical protein